MESIVQNNLDIKKDEPVTRGYFDEKFEEFATIVKQGFDEMGERIDTVEQHLTDEINGVKQELSGVKQELSSVEQRLTKEINKIQSELIKIKKKIETKKKKMDRLFKMEDEDVKAMQADIAELREKQNILEKKVWELERQNVKQ